VIHGSSSSPFLPLVSHYRCSLILRPPILQGEVYRFAVPDLTCDILARVCNIGSNVDGILANSHVLQRRHRPEWTRFLSCMPPARCRALISHGGFDKQYGGDLHIPQDRGNTTGQRTD
jgi:hypothetical protein